EARKAGGLALPCHQEHEKPSEHILQEAFRRSRHQVSSQLRTKECGTRKFNGVRLGVVEGWVTRQHFDPSEWWSPPRVG
ncbi:MAG TPA: hypothetical protein VK829_20040, partial [Terriglobales bacterium]|nr:hypothetical protein [Terriglobales bacterium]